MNRTWTSGSKREAPPQSASRARVRAQRQHSVRELARDLAVLVQVGLIAPIGPVAGASDETLRFSLTEIGQVTAAGIAMRPLAKETTEAAG
jgi:hypothetical protein